MGTTTMSFSSEKSSASSSNLTMPGTFKLQMTTNSTALAANYDDIVSANFDDANLQDKILVAGYEVVSAFDTEGAFVSIRFSDKPDEGSTITLVDADGTSTTFEIDNEANGVTGSNVAVDGIAAAGGGANGTASDLAAKVNGVLALAITATVSSGHTVKLQQDTKGTAGHTTVTVNDNAHWASTTTQTFPLSFSNGGQSVKMQAGDGSGNWCDVSTLVENALPGTTGVTYVTYDTRNLYIPTMRFQMNSENRLMKDTSDGVMNFRLATPS
jgi:hypothetical protein